MSFLSPWYSHLHLQFLGQLHCQMRCTWLGSNPSLRQNRWFPLHCWFHYTSIGDSGFYWAPRDSARIAGFWRLAIRAIPYSNNLARWGWLEASGLVGEMVRCGVSKAWMFVVWMLVRYALLGKSIACFLTRFIFKNNLIFRHVIEISVVFSLFLITGLVSPKHRM